MKVAEDFQQGIYAIHFLLKDQGICVI